MAETKRKASIATPMFCALRNVRPKVPRAADVETKALGSLEFRRIAAPSLVKQGLGAPAFILSFDIETHDWVNRTKEEKKGHIGQFGWYTMDPAEDLRVSRIVELGWAMGAANRDGETLLKSRLVKPIGFTISDKAFKCHRISNEEANSGASLVAILEEFMSDVRIAFASGGRICAHNFEFDAGIIFHELGRCGLNELQKEWGNLAMCKSQTYCTMNPDANRWVLECLGHDVGATTIQHTKGIDFLLSLKNFFVSPLPKFTGNLKRHRAGCDAVICKLIYSALLHHAGALVADSSRSGDVVPMFQSA